jgi:hypothetical protein
MDEDSIATRLMRISQTTSGAMEWTDTAGLRQIQRVGELDTAGLLKSAFDRQLNANAAA